MHEDGDGASGSGGGEHPPPPPEEAPRPATDLGADCAALVPGMPGLLEGGGPGPLPADAEEHLRSCLPCRRRVAIEAAFRDARRARAEGRPDDLDARLRAALVERDGRAPDSGWSRRARGVAAVAAIALACGILAVVAAGRGAGDPAANPLQARGMLYCPGCLHDRRDEAVSSALLAGRDPDPPLAHAVLHLRANDGRDWQLVPSGAAATAGLAHERIPRPAIVVGTAFPESHLLEVSRVLDD